MVFPINRSILWSREPTGKPHYVHSREVVPPLFVDPRAMVSLLRSCIDSATSSVEKIASVEIASCILGVPALMVLLLKGLGGHGLIRAPMH